MIFLTIDLVHVSDISLNSKSRQRRWKERMIIDGQKRIREDSIRDIINEWPREFFL
jgi:hypothetical protein